MARAAQHNERSVWTDAAVDELKRLWGEGWSAGQIAGFLLEHRLGDFTRNAVIGKVHRLGLAGRATKTGAPRSSRRRAQPGATHAWRGPSLRDAGATPVSPAAVAQVRAERAAEGHAVLAALEEDGAQAVNEGRGVPLLEAGPRQCRRPLVGEGAGLFVCGAPVQVRRDGRPDSVCAPCSARLRQPLPPLAEERLAALASYYARDERRSTRRGRRADDPVFDLTGAAVA